MRDAFPTALRNWLCSGTALAVTLMSPPGAVAQRPAGCSNFLSGGREYAVCVFLDESLFQAEQGILTAWYAYGLARAKWVREHDMPQAPAVAFEGAFAEELYGRETLATVWEKLRAEQPTRKNPYLDGLLRAHRAGYLPEFVWSYHRARYWEVPDQPLRLTEYGNWHSANLRGHTPETLASISITEHKRDAPDSAPAPGEAATQRGGYGYSPDDPVKIGGVPEDQGPRNERGYLERLRGPNGQRVRYRRIGSCCHFETPNAPPGVRGLLDRYAITYEGLEQPVVLYLNMYDYEEPRAPEGFTLAPRDRN